ncbi:polyprenyl synthetase family protein [Thermodesulfobacteriota bacterium]
MNHTLDQILSNDLKSEMDLLNKALEVIGKDMDDFMGGLLSYVLFNSGKRIRPMLVALGSALGESNPDHVRGIEMAVELIHIATLVHDDLIDKADMRRGQKTVASKHGVDTAVLLGDYLYTLAFNQVAEVANNEVLKLLVKTASVICSGEIGQLNTRFHYNLSEKEYYSFIGRKTASFFGAAARSGAILAKQDLNIQEALDTFGTNLGMSFQIKDDLLDLTGDEEVVGKTLRTDLINRKMTLPLIHYRNSLDSPEDFDKLMDHLSSSDDQLSDLVDKVNDAGSMEYAEEAAKNYIQKALDCLEELPEGTSKDQLSSLAKQSLDRKF